MSFRCLFVLRTDGDINDSQPFCYKPFSNFNKIKKNTFENEIPLENFNNWYTCVLATLSNKTYSKFDENSINEYLGSPFYKVVTKTSVLWPCVLLNIGNYVFGGLLQDYPSDHINNYSGQAVDFLCGMSQYFIEIFKKNPKLKMMEILQDFYYFIRVVCPYGTPLTSNTNLVDFVRSPESAVKSSSVLPNEKGVFSINQIPNAVVTKNKEVKVTIEEIVTGVLHESRNGDLKHDIEIVGEVTISASNLNINSEISMTIRPSSNKKLFNRAVLIDLLMHPSCLFCDYKSPVNISMTDRRSVYELSEKNTEDSSPISCYSLTSNSIVQKSFDLDNGLLNRRLSQLNSSISVNSDIDYNKPTSITVRVKPWAETYTLLSYRFMQHPDLESKPEYNLPFVTALRSPEPPLFGSYQFEDHSSSDLIGNLVLRLSLNSNVMASSEKNKVIEFTKLEVILPFPNRHPLADISKCTASQGKVNILEQNRHIMVWSLGSNFKSKNEASLIASIKFSSEASKNPFIDQFCVGSNVYAQVNFVIKSTNISGLAVDQRSFRCTGDRSIKFTQQQECKSYNFKIWNSMGDCPMELQS